MSDEKNTIPTTDAEATKSAKDANSKSKPHHPASKKNRNKKSGGSLVSWILLFVIAGGGYWVWQELQRDQRALNLMQDSLETFNKQLQQQAQNQQNTLKNSLDKIQKQSEETGIRLDEVFTRMGNTTREWVISEADYLMQIANHRLSLTQDIQTAITALTLADQRLATLTEPTLLKVRKTIASEITRLKSLNISDRTALSLQISELMSQVETLPILKPKRTEATESPLPEVNPANTQALGFFEALWNAFKDLIKIRHHAENIKPLITENQAQVLKQNLLLKLEQTRLAVLQANQQLYENNIDQCIQWLTNYFDTAVEETQSMIKLLGDLKSQRLSSEMPDISKSLRQLRTIATQLDLNITENSPKGGQ
ncbi:MAG: uroporphyrinogen-III C-methyltransferase [Nitrosopumilus sp.]|nr:uroporphyrinogen-III C-methyltransferase [Gammaproteobacteria bacterium]MDH5666031.1 uroporphyrinogen-III C-methyltransferase [Nitrosopumilus sp.]MDH5729862.1 uroporphyrinogen-III C-methyltransferase [Gammaproteobacteria bacterium]